MSPRRRPALRSRSEDRYPKRFALGVGVAAAVLASAALAGSAMASGDSRLRSDGALLTPPRESRTVTLAPTSACRTLLTAGTGDCGIVHAAGGDLLFTVEPGPPDPGGLASRPWTVTVYRTDAAVPNGWAVALATTAQNGEPGPLYANVTAKPAMLTPDGRQSLVIGYRAEGTGEILDLDIVTGTPQGPRVAAHSELYKGVVQILSQRLVTYPPIYRTRDGNCCPSYTERDEIRYRNGGFVVSRGRRVPTRQLTIPPGDLG